MLKEEPREASQAPRKRVYTVPGRGWTQATRLFRPIAGLGRGLVAGKHGAGPGLCSMIHAGLRVWHNGFSPRVPRPDGFVDAMKMAPRFRDRGCVSRRFRGRTSRLR